MPDATDARRRLSAAALEVVRREGIAGVSARTVARAGGFSQALIFYHFASVEDLLVAACEYGSAERVDHWRDRLQRVTSLGELVDLAERLHADEEDAGNVTVLAQFLAGAQTHPALRAATRTALDVWIEEVRPVVRRLVGDSLVEGVVDPDDLAELVADAFIGIELAGSTREPTDLRRTFATLRRLVTVVESLTELGGVAGRVVERRIARQR